MYFLSPPCPAHLPHRRAGVKFRQAEAVPAEPAVSDRALVKDCRVLESQPHRELTPVVPRWVGHLTPLADSAR